MIKEGDEEEKEDDEEEINTNKKENLNNESLCLLKKIDLWDESEGDNDNDNVPIFSGFSQIRNTVNSFINKKFMFPKLHNKLRDTIAIKDQYISEAKVVGKLPVPYLSAIKFTTDWWP